MTEPPLHPAAEAAHLSQVLGARVRAVTVESVRPTILSRIIRLRLIYDGDPGPASLILKTRLPGAGDTLWNGGRQEVVFYRQIGPSPRTPHCFEAEWDEQTRDWHLLLEDLTDSHTTVGQWPIPPALPACERMIDAWAAFHAEWWDDPRLGTRVGAWGDEASLAAHVRISTERFGAFCDRLGDRLPAERRAVYEAFLAAMPRLSGRTRPRRNLTIIHNDAHVWNVFLPRDGGSDVRLFDWDAWRIDVASHDLAYMMAVHWYPDRRQRFECALLDRYHAALLAHGVTGYDRAALWEDYRRSVLFQIMRPVWQAANGIPPDIWWGHLERIMLAVDDLGCRALLD